MTKEKLIDVLIDCINKNDYSTLISRTTYEERYDFFFGGKLINVEGNNVFDYFGSRGMFENLFTEREAKNLIDYFIDVKSRYIIILNLSDEEKIKHINEIIENNYYDIGEMTPNKYFLSFKDKELMSKIIYENYKLFSNINKYDMINYLKIMTGDYKLKLFSSLIQEQLNSETKIIDSYFFPTIINYFSNEQKEEVLDIVLSIQTNEKIIDSFYIPQILDCFPYENKKNILEKIYNYFITNEPDAYINRSSIIQKFKIEDLKDVIKILISGYSNKMGIYSYKSDIEDFCTDYNSTVSIIEMTLDIEKETNVKLLSGYTFNRLIDKLSFEQRIQMFNKYVLENKKIDFFEFILNTSDIDFKYFILEQLIKIDLLEEKTFKIVNHIIQVRNNDIFADGKANHPLINKLYCERYNLNEENFTTMVNNYGYIIISFLDNQNIINAINLPREEFIKYMEIFNNHNLTDDDINNVCNALLQREFRLQNKEDYNIFSTIEKIITSKTDNAKQELISIINKIEATVDIEKHLVKYGISKAELIELLLINNKNSINIINEITNKYIATKREIYVNRRLQNSNEELYLEKKLEKQFYKKTYISLISERDIIYDILYEINRSNLDEEQLKLVKNKELLSKVIKFKKDPINNTLTPEEKSSLKTFETLLNILYEKQTRSDEIKTENPKYSYRVLEITSEQILNIMANINVDNLQKNVLSSDTLYKSLLENLEKYHFIGWHKTFTDLATKADIDLSDGTLAGLISYYNEIYPKLNDKSNYLTRLLDYGNLYDYTTMRYKYLFGSEDFALLAANEGKNKASMSKYKRLEKAVLLVRKMYQRKNTTIIPMDKVFTISSDKKINVVVGNSTNMMNLTYGERTEACLRIGGAFEELFDFCISDENGFHIRFTNPKTGKFVSRVSGIRNGNTLFLNELRESVDDTYNNEDIIEALKRVCTEIINKSKESSFPIDNIIITSDFALKSHQEEEQPLHLNKKRSSLYNLPFNIKVEDDKGIVLMTSSEDNSLVPYRFSRDNLPKYECQRDKVKVFYNNDATNRTIQLHIIDELLSGNELENIEIDLNTKCDFCISGEDWYIAKTIDNKIIKYIMAHSNNKEKALEELNMYLEKIEIYKEETNVGRKR